ncbi:MAG: 50S ribosomal protein L11 methyltransferase [Epsilonproteobacteria bacterium]|nr:MAG: 50S ribosomal protein L11 methyltransferase [Campylobacterota bacterium]
MQEYYYELVVKPSHHHALFSDFLSDTLPVGFEEIDDGFIIRSEDELETIAWGIEQFAEALQKALGQSIDVEIVLNKEKNSDWVRAYQESVTPVEVAPFYIHPTWETPKEERINIVIDPALAFGTGHHPTTASCLQVIANHVKKGMNVIDVGCGSGILTIASAKLGAVVDACDTDPVSVGNTLHNADENGIVLRNVWEGSASMAEARYDVVIANIVADVLVFIARDLKKVLRPGGILILSGIMDKYEDKISKTYGDMKIIERIQQNEWVTLVVTNEGQN